MKAIPLTAILLTSAFAGEFTVKSGPLESTLTLDATFIASNATVFRIDPKQWSSFVIADLVEHGAIVEKDDVILTFERETFDKHLAESNESAKGRKIALANAERELADLEVTTPRVLEGLKLAHDRANESLDYFEKTGRALSEEGAREGLDRAKRSVSYVEEELKQLLKMYEEDGITEETEEIILTRQKTAVKSAQFSLKKAVLGTAWTLEKTIPRQAVDLQRTFNDALLAYETGEFNLPRTLEAKTLSVAKAKRDDAEADKKLAELEADGEFLSITAPADGIIYYGEINDHSWSPGSTAKFLFEHGSAPADTALMTLVPTGSVLTLHGSVGQADRLQIPADAKGRAEVAGLENSAFPVTLTTLAGAPNSGDQFAVSMSVELPEDSPLVTGMKAKVKLITYSQENAISIPKDAITNKDGKSTVKLKMADGKDEVRAVKTGHAADGKTEILEGLEVDQVILVPDETN
ncbi:MAG: HlyD family secretion protein [Paracoccaceae bacterium]|jgi:HlyD family secretion protein